MFQLEKKVPCDAKITMLSGFEKKLFRKLDVK